MATPHKAAVLVDSPADLPTHEEIAALAYQHWENRGRPIGSPEEDWLRAEQDLLLERLIWGKPSPKTP